MSFLKFFLYIKRNAIKLGILIVIGLIIGFGLNTIVDKKMKIEVIVKPNSDSKTYLYDVINEIKANLQAKDSAYFEQMEIDIEDLKGFEIEITEIEKEEIEDLGDELKYLELLEKFRDESGILDVVQNQITSKSTLNQRINFYFKNPSKGRSITDKLIKYINSNEYYNNLIGIQVENAKERIKNNEELVDQIDNLITLYSDDLLKEAQSNATFVLNDNERLNIPGLLRIKNELIRDIESKKIEILTKKEAISVISKGGTQEVQKSFFGQSIILIPTLLILLFILLDVIKAINKKASEL